jgi:acyl carrier protein
MIQTTEDRILDEVVAILVDVIGEDFLLDVEVTSETSFNDDLAVESIEFVALAERLREKYGDRVDFVAFVGEMDLEEIVSMTVGRLVSHIHQCINPQETAAIQSGGEIDG